MPRQVGREFRPWWKRGQPAKFGNLKELQESRVYLLLNPRLDKAARCVPFFNVHILSFWKHNSLFSSYVMLIQFTGGVGLKTSISVSLVIVVGADEEQLRGTGGGIEVTMTIWNACNANMVAKEHLVQRRKVAPSHLAIQPPGLLRSPKTALPSHLAFYWDPRVDYLMQSVQSSRLFLRTAKWRDWHLPRAQAPVNPVHKTPSCPLPC